MFYCIPCATAYGYPETLFTSYGACECCGKAAQCFSKPSSQLTEPKTIKQVADEAVELGHVLVKDMTQLLDQAKILVQGWKARDFLDHHKENPCVQCAQAALFSTGVNASLEQAQEMMCSQVLRAVDQVRDARKAVEWFK